MSMTFRSRAPLRSSSASVVSRNRRRVRWARRPIVRPSVATTSAPFGDLTSPCCSAAASGRAIDRNLLGSGGDQLAGGLAGAGRAPPGAVVAHGAARPALGHGDLAALDLEGLP